MKIPVKNEDIDTTSSAKTGKNKRHLSRRKFIFYGSCVAGSMAFYGGSEAVANESSSTSPQIKVPPGITTGTKNVANITDSPGANPAAPHTFFICPQKGENIVSEYPFNGSSIYGALISNLHDFNTNTLFSKQDNVDIILTNLGPQSVFVSATKQINDDLLMDTPLRRAISPLQSTIVRSGTVITTADASSNGFISLIQIRNTRNIESEIFSNETKWAKYQFPDGMPELPLWISEQLHLSQEMHINPWALAEQPVPANSTSLPYELYVNLWWLPAGADAGIHAAHHRNFFEVHTQLLGFGRMQKFTDLSRAREANTTGRPILPEGGMIYPFDNGHAFSDMYEESRMAPGSTHKPMPIVTPYDAWKEESDISKSASIDDPCFYYPPHQYYADTDSVWVAFEFHRSANKK